MPRHLGRANPGGHPLRRPGSVMSVGKCFGANFARCRKNAGLTQEAVSHMAGLHRTEIGTLERGNRIPRIDTLVKLAATVGVKPEDLLEGIVWKPGKIYSGGFV